MGSIYNFLDGQKFSFVIFFLLIFIVVFYIRYRGLKNYQDNRTVVAQYNPPVGISPVFSRYLITGGRLGGMTGEISISGLQTIMLIDLYEHGALNELKFIDDHTLSYKINPDYKNKILQNEDSAIFLDYLVSKVGKEATLKEEINKKGGNSGDGYAGINLFWSKYWFKDLFNLSTKSGYMKKDSILSYFISWFSVSITFGVFFSMFLMLIPFVGYFIVAIILIPLLLIFGVSILLNMMLQYVFNTNLIFEFISNSLKTHQLLLVFVPFLVFLSWIIIFMILGSSTKKAVTNITPKGKDIILQLKGYMEFLKKTDLDRLSYSINRDSNKNITDTTKDTSFVWLAIFSIAKDKHWDQFYEIHGVK